MMQTSSSEKRPPGLVCTFYSYKGGVGRSMALANAAAWLAKWGQRVLIIDWDLEAPGIEKYFRNWLSAENAAATPGVVDLVTCFARHEPLPWRQCLVEVLPPRVKPIHIITAGSEDGEYLQRLRAIKWEDLFEKSALGNYLESLRNEWRAEYDFVLLDSRTGVTDIGGICTIHLPDALFAMFTTNDQSLQGVRKVLESARRGHADLPVDRRKLVVVPVPCRDETDKEQKLAEEWRGIFARELAGFMDDWIPSGEKGTSVLDYLKIPYVAYWSFGERVPVFEQEEPDNPKSFAYAYQAMAKMLLERFDWSEVRHSARATEEARKQEAEAARLKFETTRIFQQAQDQASVRALEERAARAEAFAKRREEVLRRTEERIHYCDAELTRLRRRGRWYELASLIGFVSVLMLVGGVILLPEMLAKPVTYIWIMFCGTAGAAGLLLKVWQDDRKFREMEAGLRKEYAFFEHGVTPYDGTPEANLVLFTKTIEENWQDAAREGDGFLWRSPAGAPTEAPLNESVARAMPSAQVAMESPSSGRFDVFISYRHSEPVVEWLREFVPLLTFWLEQSLGRRASVFTGRDLELGVTWSQAIEAALARSVCLVPIFESRYYDSEHAMAEFRAFQQAKRPIIPILFARRDAIPADAASIQWVDFTAYNFAGPGFRQSDAYVGFQRQVQQVAEVIAREIRRAS